MVTNEQATPDFGMKIRQLREERGVSLRQIADVTRISVSTLEALERNDLSQMPGGISSRSFVRSYAIEVGLDPEQAVRDFLSQFPDDTLITGSPHAAELRRQLGTARRGSSFWIVSALLAVGIAVFAFVLLR